MSATERLAQVQTALNERGVKDVKFYFSTEALGTLSQAVDSATLVLEAYVQDKCTLAEKYIKPT